MSVFTPHPSAPAAVRQIQRTMIIQVVYVLIFAALNQSHRGDYAYYQPSEGLIAVQALLGVALLGCAFGIGQLASWSLPVSLGVEIASLALGVYSLVDSKSGLAAGFIIAGFNLYRLAQSDVQRALKAGPRAFTPNPYAGQQFPGQAFGTPQAPYGGQAPYGAQPYGAPQTPYGAQPYGAPQTPYGAPPPFGAQPGGPRHPLDAAQPPRDQAQPPAAPAQPETDYYGRPINPDSRG